MATVNFADTMIGSSDLSRTANFYQKFLGMEISNPGDGESFLILKDQKTQQTLCVVRDPSIQNSIPSLEAKDLESAIADLEKCGGRLISKNKFPSMWLAKVEDVDGRAMCIWQEA